jgi:hypothetical protein
MLKTLVAFLFPQAIGLYPAVGLSVGPAAVSGNVQVDGGTVNIGAVFNLLAAVSNNGAPNAGSVNFSSSAAASITLTNMAGLTQLLTNGGAVTVTLDNAPNVVAQIPGPFNGMKFPMTIALNAVTSVATPTVTNTGITLSGTTSVAANSYRLYQGQITQLTTTTVNPLTAGTTFTSIAQIGSTNLYTLTLGTNAITTVVGNLIYIGVTAGTLPAGWYPCYSAGTTSIVVALPTSGTAWTATAASMTQPTVVPATYAPLITLTGLLTVTGTIAA